MRRRPRLPRDAVARARFLIGQHMRYVLTFPAWNPDVVGKDELAPGHAIAYGYLLQAFSMKPAEGGTGPGDSLVELAEGAELIQKWRSLRILTGNSQRLQNEGGEIVLSGSQFEMVRKAWKGLRPRFISLEQSAEAFEVETFLQEVEKNKYTDEEWIAREKRLATEKAALAGVAG